MTTENLSQDLDQRREIAGALARYADGSHGLGMGTALAGGLAVLNPILMPMAASWMIAHLNRYPNQEMLRAHIAPLLLLAFPAITLINAFLWLLLRDSVQRRLYRRFGDARSAPPSWERSVGLVSLASLAIAGIWICKGAWAAQWAPAGPKSWPLDLWGASMLKLAAAMALSGAALLAAIAWRKVRGWRNWLGWGALSGPFMLCVAAPLFDDRQPGILTIIVLIAIAAACLYLPFMAIYVGLRDHLLYRRLVKRMRLLPGVEEGP